MSNISSVLSMRVDPLEADFTEPDLKKELNSNKSLIKVAKKGVAQWIANKASAFEMSKESLIYSNLANIYTFRQLPAQQVPPPPPQEVPPPPQVLAQQVPPPPQEVPPPPQVPAEQVVVPQAPGQQAPDTIDTLLTDFVAAKKAHNDRIKKLESWHESINIDIKNFNHLSILNLFSLIPDRRDPLYYNEFVFRANADCRITKILTASSSLIFYSLNLFYTLFTKFTVLGPLERRLHLLVKGKTNKDPIGLNSWKEELNNNGYGSDIKILEKIEKLIRQAVPRTVDWTFPEFFPEDVAAAQKIMSKRCRHAIVSIYQAYKISKVSKAREHQKKWIVALQPSEQSAEAQKAYFEEKVQENRKNFIKPRLLKWQELSFDEIQQDCIQVGIKLAALKQPPQTKSQWLIASDTEEFQLALAEQHVKHAHTLGKLVEQVARNALLRKNQIERNALYYSRLEKYLKIGLCIFKVILSFPLNLYSRVEPVIFSLFNDSLKGTPLTDIIKNRLSNLGYIYVLNPLINLKIIDIVACPLLRHIGNASNKPHEYSFEGHKIAFKKASTHLYIWTYQKIIELIQGVIKLGKIIIDNYIPGVSLKALEANPFFAHFESGFKQEYVKSEKWAQGFDDQLKLLRLKDAQWIFKPEKKPLKDQEKVGYSEDPLQQIADMLKERGLEVDDDSDPFQILGQALSNIDPDFVNQSTADFFTTHIKIWPKKNKNDILDQGINDILDRGINDIPNRGINDIFTAKTPDIQSKLRETFVLKGKKFVQLYAPAA